MFPWAAALVIQASIWNYIIKFEYGNLNNMLLSLGILRDAVIRAGLTVHNELICTPVDVYKRQAHRGALQINAHHKE